jgi:septal ring factor EnvC (AmiA/AmiB activator)
MVVVDPSTWISLAAVAISLVFGVLNAGHNGRSDIKDQLETAKQQASQQARIETSLSVIQQDTSDIKAEMKGLKSDLQDVTRRLVIVEQSTKSAHHRIDELERRSDSENKLENKD